MPPQAMAQIDESMGALGALTRQYGMTAKDLTTQVRASTREQSKVGNFIAKSTENITDMIAQIKRACDEQSRGSDQVVHAGRERAHCTQEIRKNAPHKGAQALPANFDLL